MQTTFQDIRYALRQMRHAPGFAIITVLTLALGVGAAAAVFSVMDAMLIRPLPFDHPERILVVQMRAQAGNSQSLSLPDYQDLRDSLPKTLEALAGFETGTASLQMPDGPASLNAVRSSDNFFQVFGVKPMLGRPFVRGEDQNGRNDEAVLGYDAWQTYLHADPDVVGRTVRLDGRPTVVIGVMPPGFRYPLSMRNAIYTPFHNERKAWAPKRGSHWMQSIARMRAGVTKEQALGEFASRWAALAQAYPDTDTGNKADYVSLARYSLGDTSTALWILSGAVTALLLIACVNVAGLLLARAVKREREWALRSAVGASCGRVVRQQFTESVVLGVISSALGAVIAWAMTATMRSYLITSLSRGAEVRVNGAVLCIALLSAVATALLASLLPAMGLARLDPNRVLKAGGNAGTQRHSSRLRAGLIVGQICLSFTLLAVASLLLQALHRNRSLDLGFDANHLLTAKLNLPAGSYNGRDPVANFYDPLLQRLDHAPGIVAAGLIDDVPVQVWGSNMDLHITGQPPYPKNKEMISETRLVSEGYFRAIGVPLVRGRLFDPSLDRNEDAAPAMVVNEAFVHKFFPQGGDPLGARIDDNDKTTMKSTIVGVAGNARQNLAEPSMPELDWLIGRIPVNFRQSLLSMSLVVRTAGDPQQMIPVIADALHSVDPAVPLHDAKTMHEIVEDQLIFQRMESKLFGIFASMAVLLAMAGLYGLASQEVESGTRDIGVRMALGATRMHVLNRTLSRVGLLVGGGAGLGLAFTLLMRTAFSSVVQLQTSRDGGLLTSLVASMLFLGLLAALLPARRAANIEPVRALRSE